MARKALSPKTSNRATLKRKRIRSHGLQARGRYFTPKQVERIADIVRRHAPEGRTRISQRVCRALRWRQTNGSLKDMACREVLRQLHDLEVISLPPPKWGGAKWSQYSFCEKPDTVPENIRSLSFRDVELVRVASKFHPHAALWNSLVDEYHYLHSSRIVGRQVKYLAMHNGTPIACMGWGDCAWAQSARDKWLGWTPIQRERNRHLVINNCRFLILPWVNVPNLASWLIARCSKAVISDWHDQYAIRPVVLETFVDSERFLGTCYRAANWIDVGLTSGYAKVGNSHHNSQTRKLVFAYAARPNFRAVLRGRGKL